jgi:hypothetical protein
LETEPILDTGNLDSLILSSPEGIELSFYNQFPDSARG